MRLGSNAVYRLVDPVVARISRRQVDPQEARRAVDVARWLESVDYPAVRALVVEQPITVDGRAVTFWEALSDNGDEYASVREIAEVLAKLHALEPPHGLELPARSPFGNAGHRIETSAGLSHDDRGFLAARLTELQTSYAALDFSLPQGVIHGDASVGNVLRDRHGRATVIDLDGFAIGPREWDLVLTAIFYDSFGWHTREEYEIFAEVYGFDVMQWSGYPVMRDVREFLMVTWIGQKASESETTAEEARKRISSLRTGASRKDWHPY
jgi:aminoglycoside phosphotransferase (APT) family kinase protein